VGAFAAFAACLGVLFRGAAAFTSTSSVFILFTVTLTCATATAGDFALLRRVHGRETTVATTAAAAITFVLFILILAVTRAAALASLFPRLILIPLMRRAALVGSAAAFAGYFAAFGFGHGGEPASAAAALSATRAAVRLLAMAMRALTVFVSSAGVTVCILLFARLMVLGRPAMVVCCGFVVMRGVAMMPCHAALATDLGHVFAVLAHSLATPTTGLSGLVTVEFMSIAALVRGAASFAGDLALLFGIHCSEAAFSLT